MPRLTVLPLILLATGLLPACGNSPSSSSQPLVTDVYAAGYVANNSGEAPVYWKDGLQVGLSGSGLGSANSIFVSGSDVYVAGVDSVAGAVYWKNGEMTALPNGYSANSIFVSGSDVYVAGQELPPQGPYVAVYWKNGTLVPLTDGTQSADAWSIFVSGSDVYVGGFENETIPTGPNSSYNGSFSKYWLNGTPVDLNDAMYGGVAISIFVSGNDVYAAGYSCYNLIPDCATAALWNNGTLTQLLTQNNTTASSIVVSGGDVYACGTLLDNTAEYWINGVAVPLTDGTSQAAANQIAVSGSDVYVGGADWNSQGTFAQYWKNGTPVQLTDGTQQASVFSIAVVTQ